MLQVTNVTSSDIGGPRRDTIEKYMLFNIVRDISGQNDQVLSSYVSQSLQFEVGVDVFQRTLKL